MVTTLWLKQPICLFSVHLCTVDSLFFNQLESYYTSCTVAQSISELYIFLHCLHVQENMLQHYLAFIALLLMEFKYVL